MEKEKTRQQIADLWGLKKIQTKNWVSRYNWEQAGLPLKRRGRPKAFLRQENLRGGKPYFRAFPP